MSTTGMTRSYPGCLLVDIGRVKITCQPKIGQLSYHSLSKKNISGSQISMHPLEYKRYIKTRCVRAPGDTLVKYHKWKLTRSPPFNPPPPSYKPIYQ